jgi:hypothetical protein
MRPVATESVGWGSVAEIQQKWDASAGTPTIVTGRLVGSSALRFTAGTYLAGGGKRPPQSDILNAPATFCHGLRVSAFASPDYVTFWTLQTYDQVTGFPNWSYTFNDVASMRLYNDGSLALYDFTEEVFRTDAGVLPFDTWCHLESVIRPASSTVPNQILIRVDNRTVFKDQAILLNGRGGQPGLTHYWIWGNLDGGNSVTIDFGDCVLWNWSGFGPYAAMGDHYVSTIKPTGDSTPTEWVSTEAVHADAVAAPPAFDDATYIEVATRASGPADEFNDLFTMEDASFPSGSATPLFEYIMPWIRWRYLDTSPPSYATDPNSATKVGLLHLLLTLINQDDDSIVYSVGAIFDEEQKHHDGRGLVFDVASAFRAVALPTQGLPKIYLKDAFSSDVLAGLRYQRTLQTTYGVRVSDYFVDIPWRYSIAQQTMQASFLEA